MINKGLRTNCYSKNPVIVKKSTPSINHDCTVKIDGVVKISVNNINRIRDNMENDKFSIKMFKQNKGETVLK